MSYYLGAVALLLGIFFIYRSVQHRKQIIAAREQTLAKGGQVVNDTPLHMFGVGMLPLFAMCGAFTALLLVGGFFLTEMSDHLVILDLVGLLVLVLAYTGWLIIRTIYTRIGLESARD